MIKCNLNILKVGNIKQSSSLSGIEQERPHRSTTSGSKIFNSKAKQDLLHLYSKILLKYIHRHLMMTPFKATQN